MGSGSHKSAEHIINWSRWPCSAAYKLIVAVVHPGDLPALRLSLSASDYLLFEAFQPGDLDSALGLVEHVASEAEIHT